MKCGTTSETSRFSPRWWRRLAPEKPGGAALEALAKDIERAVLARLAPEIERIVREAVAASLAQALGEPKETDVLDKSFSPAAIEQAWYQRWEAAGYFRHRDARADPPTASSCRRRTSPARCTWGTRSSRR